MRLVIIGGKAAEKIKNVIESNIDIVDITIYKNLNSFVEATSSRFFEIDRILLLQDALDFTGDRMLHSKLKNFNSYLGKWFPAVRFISLSRDMESLKKISEVIKPAYSVHLKGDKIKSYMLMDIVSDSIEELQSKYGVKIEVKDEVVIDIVEEKPKEKEKVVKQRRGLFGFFGKREKSQDKDKDKDNDVGSLFARGQGEGVDEFSSPSEEDQDTVIPGDSDLFTGSEDIGEMFGKDDSSESGNTDLGDDSDNLALGGSESGLDDVDFSIFRDDSSVDLGIGSVGKVDDLEDKRESKVEEDIIRKDMDIMFEDGDRKAPRGRDVFYHKPVDKDLGLGLGSFELVDDDFGLPLDDSRSKKRVKRDDKEEIEEVKKANEAAKERIEEIKTSMEKMEIDTDISEVEEISTSKDSETDVISVVDVPDETGGFSGDIDELEKKYKEELTPVKEKVVKVEKVVEKVITITAGERAYRNNIRVIVVTGDRKSGVTRVALNFAHIFSKEGKTLFVDYDIKRRGSIIYLGFDDIIDQEEHIQNGIGHFKSVRVLPNICFGYEKGGFDCLVSFYGNELTTEHMEKVQSLLTVQRDYANVIIDCPIENLHLLQEVVLCSEIVFCCDASMMSIINTMIALNDIDCGEKFATLLYNHSNYLVVREIEGSNFHNLLLDVVDFFDLDEGLNWGKVPILGVAKDLNNVSKGL